jgi:hypothetical protein
MGLAAKANIALKHRFPPVAAPVSNGFLPQPFEM